MWEQGRGERREICASFLDETGVISVPRVHFDLLRRFVRGEYLPKTCPRMRGYQRSDSTGMVPGASCGGWTETDDKIRGYDCLQQVV